MSQSSPDADIFLELDSTRFRGPVDFIPESTPVTDVIQLDPDHSSIILNRGAPEPDPAFALEASNGTSVLSLTHDYADDTGRLRLGNTSGTGSIRVESTTHSGVLELIADDTVRSSIGSHSGPELVIGGRISVHDTTGTPGVVFEARRAADPDRVRGVVEVHGDDVVTGRLLGEDGTLELLPPETAGGGATVAGALATPDAEADVFVDLNDTAATQPRMGFDGTTGAAVVGRAPVDQNRPGVGGRVQLHYGHGSEPETYLEAGGHDAGGDERMGELVVRRRTSSGVEPGGRIRGNGTGLEVASGVGGGVSPVMQVTDSGTVQVTGSVQASSLSPATPTFIPGSVHVEQGAVAEVEVTVGDTSTLTFEFGDQGQLGYEVTASISGYSDARLWLGIDTANPGAGSSTLELVAGDGSLSITNETTGISGMLDPGQYPIRVKEENAGSWSDIGSVTVQQP